MVSQLLRLAFAFLVIGVISAIWSSNEIISAGAFVGCGLAVIGHGLHTLAVVTKEGQTKG
jgi:hypothetical protein